MMGVPDTRPSTLRGASIVVQSKRVERGASGVVV